MTGTGASARRQCSFRLADVLCPDASQVLKELTPELEVNGEVVFMSDSGERPDHFAIVSVEGILSPLIVPTEHLRTSDNAMPNGSSQSGKSCRL